MVYVALLRGINVGGHVVKMDRLRTLFAELGYANVRTYIQSGNVCFETAENNRQLLTQTIEHHLRHALGYAVPVFLRTIPELEAILALDPLNGEKPAPDQRLCILFAANPIPNHLALPLRSPKNDMEILRVTEREAYVMWYLINGRPPASDAFLDKTLGSPLTSRFVHTTAKMVEAVKQE